MDSAALLDELPADRRLALAYAPAAARDAWLALLLLDQRLSRLVSQAREPILVQMRLAWWRDQLTEPAGTPDRGEPILALLAEWPDRHGLIELVNGWEELLAQPPICSAAILTFADGRGGAFAALSQQLGVAACADEARRCGRNWAMADLAQRLSDPAEITQTLQIMTQQNWSGASLPRALRPLTVLYGLARRKQGSDRILRKFGDGLAAVRLGLLGR